ncbi:MAG: sugar isomerase, partial [Solirubrobacterales bacterium]|nr:sugar isomerase [Solirubrobacterales bacterium]
LGERARVLVDLGHHAQGVNIEQIVALLAAEDRLGGFHFNNRKYGDDDLIVGSVNPFELFLIFVELAALPRMPRLTIDQSHNVEAMILSVVNLQEALVKALLLDRTALADAQAQGDVLRGHELVLDAYRADVRPLCAAVRGELGAEADPVAAHRASGYLERVIGERGAAAGVEGGWGR